MFRRIAVSAAALAAVALCAATAASAGSGGAGTQTFTQHGTNDVIVDNPTATNPCTGDSGHLLAVSSTDVFHITTQADGTAWVTGTAQGTVTFTADDPSNPSASGHFVLWFGDSFNDKNTVQHIAGNFNLTGTDGSHIVVHMLSHLSTNARGVPTVTFSVDRATCGA
jgi:hypothetical protein